MEEPMPHAAVPAELAYASVIVAAYLTKNPLAASEVSGVIRCVYGAIAGLSSPPPPDPGTQKPAVPIKKSVTPEYLICLEDGKQLKMLKRYLRTRYGLSIDQYRTKWNLPADYPMVAPNYAATRSAFAKKIGLGQRAENPAQGHRKRA
jgi:predicted transcriptional regulator